MTNENDRRKFAQIEGRRLHPDARELRAFPYQGEWYVEVWLGDEDHSRTYFVDESDMPEGKQPDKVQYIVNYSSLINGVTQGDAQTKIYDEPIRIITKKRYDELKRKAGEE